MKAKLKVLTLAVDDLDRSLRFYRDGLGLPTKGVIGQEFEHGSVAFFELDRGLILAVWPSTSFEMDIGIKVTRERRGAVSIGHVVRSKAEVDEVMSQAAKAGAVIVATARDRFWGGYSGYFHDPDGHLWEIAWNPQFQDEA
jgi:catechol 2,3-dioxygenase-like lactoylglutathione lyase family enzyme